MLAEPLRCNLAVSLSQNDTQKPRRYDGLVTLQPSLLTPLPSSPCVQAVQMGVLILALLGLSTALVCPDGGVCEDKNTCCKNTEGGYGCCPLPHVSPRPLKYFNEAANCSVSF